MKEGRKLGASGTNLCLSIDFKLVNDTAQYDFNLFVTGLIVESTWITAQPSAVGAQVDEALELDQCQRACRRKEADWLDSKHKFLDHGQHEPPSMSSF